MDVTTLHSLVKSRSLHLGAVIEVFLANKADMGVNQLHPQVHVSDGFEIDESKIGAMGLTKAIAEPHKTAKSALDAYLAKSGGDATVVAKLQSELADADAAKKATIAKLQASKKLAHSPDSHIDPAIYQSLEDGAAANPDLAFGFDIRRLPDFEARETIRKEKERVKTLAQNVLDSGHKDLTSNPKKPGNKDYAAQNAAYQLYKSAVGKIATNEKNLASGLSGGGYLKRGSGHAKNKSHSMFADSESALMALFGALNTEAGEQALFSLLGAGPGAKGNPRVAIHSYSAPDYLTAKALKGGPPASAHSARGAASAVGAKIPMIKRAGDVKTGALEGRTQADIKFVSVILEKEGTEVLLVTHFPVPSDAPDEVASGFVAGTADVVEKADETIVGFAKEVQKGDWLSPSP